MHRFNFMRKPIAVAAAAAAVFLAAGVAYAAIPDGNGVIHGCYLKTNGRLRVIDTDNNTKPCESKKEIPLSWSQSGPQGPPGQPGQDGSPGQQGPPGPSGTSHGYYDQKEGAAFISASPTKVVSLDNLPAGSYVVTSTGSNFENGDNDWHSCDLTSGGSLLDRVYASGDDIPYAMTVAFTLTSPGSVETDCLTNGNTGNPFVFEATMTAIKVDALN
jgi:hypothetical protein